MINAIIFSKNRACQCDLLLQSLKENAGDLLDNITVQYFADTTDFDAGYLVLRNLWKSEINFVNEKNFKDDLINLTRSTHPFTVYFTDDDIFYRKLKRKNSIYILTKPEFCCFSLRLGKNIVVQDCHRGVAALQPDFEIWNGDVLHWNWTHLPTHTNFAYPLSVDGHIFSTNMLLKYIDKFDYNNPNEFEGRLQQFNNNLPSRMACFEYSCVVNTPLNRVQESCTNLAGQFFPASAEELNSYFLENYRISLKKLDFGNILGCHQELRLSLLKNDSQ